MKGRKPKPAALRIFQGKAGHRPIKDSVKFPVETLPAPEFLQGYALEKWHQLEPVLRGGGIVTVADADALAAYCAAFGRWADAEKILMALENPSDKFVLGEKRNPLARARDDAEAAMMKYAAELGITPSSRTRITPVLKPDRPNKFTTLTVARKRSE